MNTLSFKLIENGLLCKEGSGEHTHVPYVISIDEKFPKGKLASIENYEKNIEYMKHVFQVIEPDDIYCIELYIDGNTCLAELGKFDQKYFQETRKIYIDHNKFTLGFVNSINPEDYSEGDLNALVISFTEDLSQDSLVSEMLVKLSNENRNNCNHVYIPLGCIHQVTLIDNLLS